MPILSAGQVPGFLIEVSNYLNSFYSEEFKGIKMKFSVRDSKEPHQAPPQKKILLKFNSVVYNCLNLACEVHKISCIIPRMLLRKMPSC